MGKGDIYSLLVGEHTEQSLRKSVWQFLKKLEIDLPDDITIPLLVIYLQDPHILLQRYLVLL